MEGNIQGHIEKTQKSSWSNLVLLPGFVQEVLINYFLIYYVSKGSLIYIYYNIFSHLFSTVI